MESPLTILLLIKNNKETIDQFLSSIEEINYKLIVGNIGSTDGTVEKLLHKNAQIVPLSFDDDFSKLRNFLISKVKSGWILHLEPFEQIISGIDLLKKSISGPAACYSFPVIQGDTLTKQNKLWHTSLNLKFTNPVYETIDSESKLLNCYITSQSIPQQFDVKPIIKKWHQNNPLSPDPIYYLACAELFDKNWDSFINYAEIYIHQQKKQTISFYMTNYYLSLVYSYVKNDYNKALKHISICLVKNPVMAEFWCLLGDIFYKIKQYDKAVEFYDNARIIGQRRLMDSDWPMEISKYSLYPEKMIESSKEIIKNTVLYINK